MMKKSLVRAAASVAAALVTASVFATPSHAATARNGVCESGEFCYYYNSANNGSGAISDFKTSLSAYGSSQPTCYEFKASSSSVPGYHQCIQHNAGGVWNRTGYPVRVRLASGSYTTIAPGSKRSLKGSAAYNNNYGHVIVVWSSPYI